MKNTYLLEDGKRYIKYASAQLIKHECEMLRYLQDRLPVPRIVELNFGENSFLIMTALEGINFREYLAEISPEQAIEIYKKAYDMVRRAGIVHGDLCPMNIIINNGEISGFVDFEKSRIENSDEDLKEIEFIITRHYGRAYWERWKNLQ